MGKKPLLAALCATLLGMPLAPLLDAVQANDKSHILIWYDFDQREIDTGPYTLGVFDGAQGSVSLSTDYRLSGHRAVEIKAVASDGEFAELQGFFPDKYHGRLRLHFAFLVVDPREPVNIAFAGLAHFSMQKNGIGFWLKTRGGDLFQVSDGAEVRLGRLDAFTWYVADVTYDIDRGRYDLRILREGDEEPFVDVREQSNAVGIPGSKLRKFSFIADPPGVDSSNAHFFVDDVIVTADSPVGESPFVAPGRRMLFVDIYDFWKAKLYDEPGCPPSIGPEDFGLFPEDVSVLSRLGWDELHPDRLATIEQAPRPPATPAYLRERLEAISVWRNGCAASAECEPGRCPIDYFATAASLTPEAKIYPMSHLMALAAKNRWREADATFARIYTDWKDDPRLPALAGALGMARGELAAAEEWLATAIDATPSKLDDPVLRELWSGSLTAELLSRLQASYPVSWSDHLETALSSEHRFYVLLWQRRHDEARQYADSMAARYEMLGLSPSVWLERAGDAFFYLGAIRDASQRYDQALEGRVDAVPLWLKLSDAAFRLGDHERERRYREKIYGRLQER